MKKQQRILSLLMIFTLLFPNMNIAVHAEEAVEDPFEGMINISDDSDWQGSVFGDVGGQDKITSENFEITENEDHTVTIRSSNNRGKLAGSSEGIAYYFKDLPKDSNYKFTAKATVNSWDANNQVSFGIMLRSNVLSNEHIGATFTGDYIAVGNVQQEMRGFYKYTDQGMQRPEHLKLGDTPQVGETYELSIQKMGNLYSLSIDGETQTIDDYTGELNYVGLFSSRNTTVTFSNVDLDIEGEVDLGDWNFNIFGDNTSDERNPDLTVNDDGSITIEANGGKISSSVDGISFYHKQIPVDANFEISTKAKVHKFGANNQVSFGLMLRDEIGEHRSSSGHEANYVAVGALDQSIKGFYKDGSQHKLPVFDGVIPSDGSEYDLSIKKSGDTYVLSINGNSYETITLDNVFTDEIFAGIYVARDTMVTFSDTEIAVDSRAVEELMIDSSNMEKKEFLQGESLDLTGLMVTAKFTDGSTEALTENDYIVTGFDSSEVGPNTITINYNGKTAAFNVEIVSLTVTNMDIKYYPAKTDYYIGDQFDPQGLVIIAEYNNGYQTAELTNDLYEFVIDDRLVEESYIFENAGSKEVVIRSTETPDQSTSFSVSVNDAELLEIEIKDEPEVMLYFIGDELDLDGMSVYAKYSDGKEVRLMTDEYEVTGFDSNQAGEKVLTLSHKNQTTTLTITVKVKEVQGIKVTNYPKTTYQVGENFDETGLVISKVYDNKDREALSQGDYGLNIDDYNATKPGVYQVTVIPKDTSLGEITFQVTVREEREVEWKQIRFGQSTSTANNYIETLENDVMRLVAQGGSAGKVTGDHDGITFYYAEIDAEQDNFALSADIYVEEYAKDPHDGQESFGIMARDAIGPADDSGVFASNIAAIGGYSGGTREENGTQLFVRTGVLSPDGEGSQGIQKVMIDNNRPNAENTSDNYRLTLAKTNSGFTGQLNNGDEKIIYEPEILQVQDGKMYVGFYTARLATIQVSNIDFTVTNAATDAPREYPPAEAVTPNVEILSLDKTSNEDYTLLVKSNVDGVVSVKQGQHFIAEESVVEADEVLEVTARITENADTNFSLVFLPDNTQYLTDYSKIVQNFTVTMKTFGDGGDIYVSPTGTASGEGTKENPLDLDTAIDFVQAGQKIIVQSGHYIRNSNLEIKKYNDGTKDAKKYLIADPDAETRPLIDFDKKSEGVVHSGHYWHVEGIDFARSAGNTKGYTVGGSHNIIENVRTFEHGDTGLQISRTDIYEDDYAKWPSHNLILNSISFDNRDPSDNNADGFAAKLTSGDGNIFRGTVAYNNVDDGWDLYTKVGTGAIGAVLIEDSIAFNNGNVGDGDKNGFKLGGEGVHVPHEIKNSLAFGNGTTGFASNSNPGVIATNNISINNGTNLGFTTYSGIETDFTIDGFVSIGNEHTSKDNYPSELESDINYLFDGEKSTNKSGEEISAEHTDHMIELLESMFDRDSEGRILSVKQDHWEELWDTYHKVINTEDPTDPDPEEPEEPTDPEEPKDPVVSKPDHIEDGKATLKDEDIDRVTNDGEIIVDLKGLDEVSIVELTEEQVNKLRDKNANITIQKEGVSVSIPSKYLSGKGHVSIKVENVFQEDIAIPNHKKVVSEIFRFTVEQNGQFIHQFDSEPVTIVFAVDSSKVGNTDHLKVFYLNEDTNEWVEIEGAKYEDGFVRVTTNHFSIFAVMEVEPEELPDPEPEEPEDPEEPEVPEVPTDPSAPEDPAEQPGGEDDKDSDDRTPSIVEGEDKDEDGKELPKTATSIFNGLAIGVVIMLIGSIIFIAHRRSTNDTHSN